MLLSAVSVLVVAQSSSEIPEELLNNPVYAQPSMTLVDITRTFITDTQAINISFVVKGNWRKIIPCSVIRKCKSNSIYVCPNFQQTMKRIKGITYRRCELYAGLVNVWSFFELDKKVAPFFNWNESLLHMKLGVWGSKCVGPKRWRYQLQKL